MSATGGTRLNKYIAESGVASRRGADDLISRGKVRINGRVVKTLGTIVQPGDKVDVSGTPIAPREVKTYLVLHKPVGVVTTMRDPEGRRTVKDFLPDGPRVVPVGRLDYDTSGVLLLTDDGDLAHALLHPKFEVEKLYRATIAGRLLPQDVRQLQKGLELPEFRAAGARLRIVASRSDFSVVDLTITEGRNRQVRLMFEELGHPVRALARLRFGPIVLGELPPGRTRALAPKELAALDRFRA